MKSKFKNLSFNNEDNFQEWLEKSTYMLITFQDLGQDMQTMYVHESGEILHCDFHSSIYNGQFVDIESDLSAKRPLILYNPNLELKTRYKSLIIDEIEKLK